MEQQISITTGEAYGRKFADIFFKGDDEDDLIFERFEENGELSVEWFIPMGSKVVITTAFGKHAPKELFI